MVAAPGKGVTTTTTPLLATDCADPQHGDPEYVTLKVYVPLTVAV